MAFSLQRNNRFSLFVLILLSQLMTAGAAWARDDILPLKDVKVGMKGIGKTVIHGQGIETFNVEVMGILANNKINENLLINGKSILVRVSGKIIEDAGGIAAGMSGSPVYINGKLIGGLSSGWVMTDHTVGMVTPIEEMLEIWDYPLMSALPPDSKPVEWHSSDGVLLGGKLHHRFWQVPAGFEAARSGGLPAEEPVFECVRTPIVIQGLCERAAGLLGKKLQVQNLQALPADATLPNPQTAQLPVPTPVPASGSVSASSSPSVIEPGSAMGVQLARGDINLTTLGTLTYRDGKKILGFAHPFLKKGNVSFLLTGAHIYHSFSSVQMPFKVGAPTEPLGIINQDREKGISGELGRFPVMIPVQIDVSDKDLKRSRSINYQVVRDPVVFGTVIESTFLQALEGVIDRDGEGTALMGIALECTNSQGTKLNYRRENLFYSKGDIMGTLVNEVNKLVESCVDSEIEEIIPTRLMLKIEIEQKRQTMTVEKVEVKNASITPGGVMEVWVTLRPYREKSVVKKMKIPIPADIGKEDLRLTVYGLSGRGDESVAPMTPFGEKEPREEGSGKKTREMKTDAPVHESFDAMMRAWVDSPQNSDLLFQLTRAGEEDKKIKLNGRDYESLSTNLVILGSVDSTISLSED